MKFILALIFIVSTGSAFATCVTPITRPNFIAGQTLTAASLNTQFNDVFGYTNELPGDCVEAETITSTQIDNGTIINEDISSSADIARSKLATMNIAYAAMTGGDSATSTASLITELATTITTYGGPVEIYLSASSNAVSASGSNISLSTGGSKIGTLCADIYVTRGATTVFSYRFSTHASGNVSYYIPASVIKFYDNVASGSYSYSIGANGGCSDANMLSTMTVNFDVMQMIVKELQ
jgi:hypothetical protein